MSFWCSGVSSLLHSQHLREMRFVTLAVVLLFSATIQCHASPMLSGDTITQADLLFKTKENFQHFAKTFALAEEAAMNALQKLVPEVPALSSFHTNRKLQQNPPTPTTCPTSTTTCSDLMKDTSLGACAFALAKTLEANFSPMSNPFSFASLLCMIPSCMAKLTQFWNVCICVDFQPLLNVACPNIPTATACSRNPAVQTFVAFNSDPAAGMFGLDAYSNLAKLMPTPFGRWSPDFTPCGDPKFYRRTVLINSLGVCLDELANAFGSILPTWMKNQLLPGSKSLTFGQAMVPSTKCAITFPSFAYQAICGGTVARCYSAGQLPIVSECKNMTSSFCPAGCKQQLALAGASASTSSAKCCVKWFQEQATTAPACSKTNTISLASLLGQDCVNVQQLYASSMDPPQDLSAAYSMPMFPAPCASKSPASLAVANCAVPASGLEAACPNDVTTPFVRSSMYAPTKVSTVTLRFSSSTLKAVRDICLAL
jgi:hypothetical protein